MNAFVSEFLRQALEKVGIAVESGMWMGGMVPLGYDVKTRKLLPNQQAFLDAHTDQGTVYQTAVTYVNPQWIDIGKDLTAMFTGAMQPEDVLVNIDKRRAHLSTLICSGQTTREQALEEMQVNGYPPAMMEEDRRYTIVDVFKLITKEDVVPDHVERDEAHLRSTDRVSSELVSA